MYLKRIGRGENEDNMMIITRYMYMYVAMLYRFLQIIKEYHFRENTSYFIDNFTECYL